MKGLLIKDIMLMKSQKRFFLVVILLAVVMAVSTKETSFLMGYMNFVMPFFALSSVSYDEFDNGNAFLFTLPITRRLYVTEKYCFTLLLALASLAVSALITVIYGLFTDMGAAIMSIYAAPTIFAAMALLFSLLLPIQIKFGSEKSRMTMMLVAAAVAIVLIGGERILSVLGVDISSSIGAVIESEPLIFAAAVALTVCAAILISLKISIRIISKKEF